MLISTPISTSVLTLSRNAYNISSTPQTHGPFMPAKRDFLSVTDITPDETLDLLNNARETKSSSNGRDSGKPLAGKSVALLFDKPSLRTRVSFQVGIQELGGYSVFLGKEEVGLGGREPVSDVAKVLSGYVD